MIGRLIFGFRRSGSEFDGYLNSLERKGVAGAPTAEQAKRDYVAFLRSQNPYVV